MAKIPTYQSQSGINVGSNPEMSMGAVNKSIAVGEEMHNAGKGLTEGINKSAEMIRNTLQDIKDFREKNEAHAFVTNGLYEIKTLADQDIDFDPTKYEAMVDKLGQETSKTISSGKARDEFMASFDQSAIATKWGIKSMFRDKSLKSAQDSIEYNRQSLINAYADMSPEQQLSAVASFKQMLIEGVDKGIYTRSDAQAMNDDMTNKVQYSVANKAVLTDPANAKAELEKGKDGEFGNINDENRLDLIKKAGDYEKKYKAEQDRAIKEKINTNEDNVIKRMIDPKQQFPSEGEVINLLNDGQISANFAKAVVENIRSPKKDKENKKTSTFNNIAEFIFNPDNNPEDVRVELVKKNATGELPNDEFNLLYTFNQNTTKDSIDKASPKKSILESLTFWSDENAGMKTSEAKARMFKKYIMKVNQGENPGDAVKKVIAEEVMILHPNAATYPKEGQLTIDQNGNQKIIMPNGELVEYHIDNTKPNSKE